MSCSHLHTKPIEPATHFGNTLRCLDCELEFQRVSPPLEQQDDLASIARYLREHISGDYRGQAMDWAARQLEKLSRSNNNQE